MKKIDICITSNDDYAEHMYITIFSVLYNLNKCYSANIWILDSWLNEQNKNLLKSIEGKFKSSKINFVYVNEEKYKWLPDLYWTWQTYFRIDIPNLLPKLEKVLYLDPDIVVDADISWLYEIDINWYAIWAPTFTWSHRYYEKVLQIPISLFWEFCAWVMLMNLNYFRLHKLSELIFEYMDKNVNIIKSDQDALNAVLYDKRLNIDLKYSVDHYVYMRYKQMFSQEKPIIIHFWWWKPWKKYCPNPLSYMYHDYRKLAWLDPITFSKSFNFCLRLKHFLLVPRLVVIYQKIVDMFRQKFW